MSRSKAHLLTAALIGFSALGVPAHADDFYKGKTFTIVAGFSPAGGYDHYARDLARYIGNPTTASLLRRRPAITPVPDPPGGPGVTPAA